jgi:hypothetical protein
MYLIIYLFIYLWTLLPGLNRYSIPLPKIRNWNGYMRPGNTVHKYLITFRTLYYTLYYGFRRYFKSYESENYSLLGCDAM